jgi:hypothetical protein
MKVRFPGIGGLLLVLVLAAETLGAQEPRESSQVPRRLYVGDRGRLILNPGPGFEEVSPFVIDDPRRLPQGQDLKLFRLEFRRLRDAEWLLIDFTAFTPGTISLPPLNLPQMPGLDLESYEVNVASILEGDPGAVSSRGTASSQGAASPRGTGGAVLALSGPLPPLAVTGTAFLIYGTASMIVLALLISLGLGVWGRPYLAAFLENHRRRRLVRLMGRIGKRLRGKINPGSCREVLRELSSESRSFLGYFYDWDEGSAAAGRGPNGWTLGSGALSGGRNCRALTAAEFFSLPPLFPAPQDGQAASPWADLSSPPALGNFFRLLDRLRYSGEPAGPAEVTAAIDGLDRILEAMDTGFRARGFRAWASLSRPAEDL